MMDSTGVDREFEEAIKIPRYLLQLVGLWPRKFYNWPKFTKSVFLLVYILTTIFILLPCILFFVFVEKSLTGRIRILGPFSYFLVTAFKAVIFLLREDKIWRCIERLRRNYHHIEDLEQMEVVRNRTKFANRLSTMCMLCMFGSGMPYAIITPIVKEIVVGNDTFKYLAYPAFYVIFDPQISPNFQLVYAFQLLSVFLASLITCGVCSVAITCVANICGQCDIMSLTLKNVVTKEGNRQHLLSNVTRHLKILRFAADLEDLFQEICLAEIYSNSFNICVLGYYFITEIEAGFVGSMSYLFLIVAISFNTFIFCHVGENLTEFCSKIADDAYSIDWYQLKGKEGRGILLIILLLSQRTTRLTGGKIAFMSLRTFANVLKAAVTYLNMLRTVTAI